MCNSSVKSSGDDSSTSEDDALYNVGLKIFFPKALKCFEQHVCLVSSTMSRKLTSQKYSFQPIILRVQFHRPPESSSCPVSSPRLCTPPLSLTPGRPVGGSSDDLGLPDLTSHLGATLHDDRGTGGALAVQTQAADHMLEGCAFGLPLLSGLFGVARLHFDL